MSEAATVDLSILLPTRGRAARVERLLDSIVNSTVRPERLEVVLRVDADDAASQRLSHPDLAIALIVGPPGEPMGRMFRACYEKSQGRLLMLMNDDVVFRTRGWDAMVLDAFGRFPDGVALVWGNDLDQGSRLPTFPILSRTVAELLGEVCPEEYRHFHIESHLHDVFRRLAAAGYERRVYLDAAVFEHEHYVVGKAARDATYRRDQYLGADEQLYFELAAYRQHCAAVLRAHIEYALARGVHEPVLGRSDADGGLRLASERPRILTVFSVGNRPEGSGPRPPSAVWEPLLGTVIKIVCVPSGPEFARMSNMAIARAEGDLVGFVPQGALPGAGWPGSAQRVLDANERVAACGVRVVDPWKRQLLHAGLAFVQASGDVRYTHLYHGLPADHPVSMRRRRLQAVSYAGVVVRRTALVEVGGLDETQASETPAIVDLCLRLGQRGWLIEYVPDAVLYWDRPLSAEVEAVVPARAAEAWRWRVRSDFEEILRQDGFRLAPTGASLEIRPPS